MLDDILSITSGPILDNPITKVEVHTYNPYANTSFGNNDEIRIPVKQQDLYTIPCDSYLRVEGRVVLQDSSPPPPKADERFILDNNCAAFMFDEIRYELNGVEIDRSRNPGITTALKNYLSLSHEKSNTLDNDGWRYKDGGENASREIPLDFDFSVPLNALLGFCEDYRKIVMNALHELILIRARTDTNAMYGTPSLNAVVKLHKVQWRMPHVNLDELHKLSTLRIFESGKSISMSYRSWDLYK